MTTSDGTQLLGCVLFLLLPSHRLHVLVVVNSVDHWDGGFTLVIEVLQDGKLQSYHPRLDSP